MRLAFSMDGVPWQNAREHLIAFELCASQNGGLPNGRPPKRELRMRLLSLQRRSLLRRSLAQPRAQPVELLALSKGERLVLKGSLAKVGHYPWRHCSTVRPDLRGSMHCHAY